MTNIRETVLNSLNTAGYGSYSTYAEPVIAALEAREHDIADSLIGVAVDKGLERDEAVQVFEGVGLSLRPQPVDVTGGADVMSSEGGFADILNRINDTLSGLTEFARQHGFRG